ncbi:hypothetical protein JYU14_03625 [Simkania negevensis]|uniref:Uncharacterized protein n=1 Tax=Simkania negevensis TaxID=83561 RepID=A0ABS3AS08_9BACT|nr:hypothetical protein [Simkania negevensis]
MGIKQIFSQFDPNKRGIDSTTNQNEANELWQGRSLSLQYAGKQIYLSSEGVFAFLKKRNELTPEELSRAASPGGLSFDLLSARLSEVLSKSSSSSPTADKTSTVGSPIILGTPASFSTSSLRTEEESRGGVLAGPKKERIKQLLLEGGSTGADKRSIESDFITICAEMEEQLKEASPQDRIIFLAHVDNRLQSVDPDKRVALLKELAGSFAQEKKRLGKIRTRFKEAATQAGLRAADAEVRRMISATDKAVSSSNDPAIKTIMDKGKKWIEQDILKELGRERVPPVATGQQLTRGELSTQEKEYLDKEQMMRLLHTAHPQLQKFFSRKKREIGKERQQKLIIRQSTKEAVLYSDNAKVKEIVKEAKRAVEQEILKELGYGANSYRYDATSGKMVFPKGRELSPEDERYLYEERMIRLLETSNPKLQELFLKQEGLLIKNLRKAVLSSNDPAIKAIVDKEKEDLEKSLLVEITKEYKLFPPPRRREELSGEHRKEFEAVFEDCLLTTSNRYLQQLFLQAEQGILQHSFSVTELKTGTANIVYEAKSNREATGYTKLLHPGIPQRAVDISTIGALGQFFPEANIVQTYSKDVKQTPDKVTGSQLVTATPVEELQSSPEGILWGAPATQHTALAALSLQLWDGHPANMGKNKKRELVLFDLDTALLESNCASTFENTLNSPLGQLYLQTHNPPIKREILDEHLEQLEEAIESQITARRRCSAKGSVTVTNLVSKYFANDPRFLIYGIHNDLTSDVTSLAHVRSEFKKMVTDPTFQDHPIWKDFKKAGLSDKEITSLRKNPMLLHPTDCSIVQLQALRERHSKQKRFLLLKDTLTNNAIPKEEQARILRQHLDSMPITANEKLNLLHQLRDPKTIYAAVEQARRKLMGPIHWNQLAYAAYPTLAQMHQWATRQQLLFQEFKTIFDNSHYDAQLQLLSQNIDLLPIRDVEGFRKKIDSTNKDDVAAAYKYAQETFQIQSPWGAHRALGWRKAPYYAEFLSDELERYTEFKNAWNEEQKK